MRHNAAQWVPLFPEEEVPRILEAVLLCSAELRKRHATEYENKLSDRLRKTTGAGCRIPASSG